MELREHSAGHFVGFLVGNKCDDQAGRTVDRSEGERLAATHQFQYWETSAKDNLNVKEMFEGLISAVHTYDTGVVLEDPARRQSTRNDRNDPSIVRLSGSTTPMGRSPGPDESANVVATKKKARRCNLL